MENIMENIMENTAAAQPEMDDYTREVFGLEPTEPAQESPQDPPQTAQKPAQDHAGEPAVPGDLPGPDAQKAQQETEERHRQAAARRAREDAARAQAEQERLDSVYADLFRGQNNPFTGKPILTKKDYEEYIRQTQENSQSEELKKAGIDKALLEQLVDERVTKHPDVVAARQEKERAQRERQARINAQADQALKEGIEKIHALDESIKSVEDIYKTPYKDQFLAYLQKGLSMEEAFYLSNREGLQKKNAAAARQAAINQHRSKAGMVTDAGSGSAATPVPADMAESFREFMPDATDAEIEKAWRSYQKQLK